MVFSGEKYVLRKHSTIEKQIGRLSTEFKKEKKSKDQFESQEVTLLNTNNKANKYKTLST